MPPEIIKCINDTYYLLTELNEEPSAGFFMASDFHGMEYLRQLVMAIKISPVSVRLCLINASLIKQKIILLSALYVTGKETVIIM